MTIISFKIGIKIVLKNKRSAIVLCQMRNAA